MTVNQQVFSLVEPFYPASNSATLVFDLQKLHIYNCLLTQSTNESNIEQKNEYPVSSSIP